MADPELGWRDCSWADLSTAELYAIMHLRQLVFVIEQKCLYQDLDGLDSLARHIWAEMPSGIAAYLRILPAGVKYREVAIGRVVVHPNRRGTGLGRELMRRGLAAVGNVPVRISAQAHLERFYSELGFQRASEPYDEDGIPHVEMVRAI